MLKEIEGFASEFINSSSAVRASHPQRSAREATIEAAAKKYLNKIKSCSCPDWYMDTIFELINLKKRLMKSKYLLQQGGVLHVFSRMDLLTTNQNITDDLAELHLGLDDRKLAVFEKYPTDDSGEWKGITQKRFNELCKEYNVSPKDRFEGCQDFVKPESGKKANEPEGEKKTGKKEADKKANEPEGDKKTEKPETDKVEDDGQELL